MEVEQLQTVVYSMHGRKPLSASKENFRRSISTAPLPEKSYHPPQPSISFRGSDIDEVGTRTYSSLSTSDIVQEQHRLIHDIYNDRKSTRSPNPSKKRHHSITSDQNVKVLSLKFLSANGKQISVNRQSRPRRPSERLSKSASLKDSSSKNEFHLKIDAQHKAKIDQFHISEHMVKNYREELGKGLDQGKADQAQMNPIEKAGKQGQWLSFGGDSQSGGAANVFTELLQEGMFYEIECETGCRVSKHLSQKDKIRIGVNGNLKKYRQDLKYDKILRAREVTRNTHPFPDSFDLGVEPKLIPLCWDDQVSKSNKLMKPRSPPPVKAESLNETHKVFFKQNKSSSSTQQIHVTGQRLHDTLTRFSVRSQTKPRLGLDGHPTTSYITSVKIGRPEIDVEMSVDEVVAKHFGGNVSAPPPSRDLSRAKSHPESTHAVKHQGSSEEVTIVDDDETTSIGSKSFLSETKSSRSMQRNSFDLLKIGDPTSSIPLKSYGGTINHAMNTEWNALHVRNSSPQQNSSPQPDVLNTSHKSESCASSRQSSAKKKLSKPGKRISFDTNLDTDKSYIKFSQPILPLESDFEECDVKGQSPPESKIAPLSNKKDILVEPSTPTVTPEVPIKTSQLICDQNNPDSMSEAEIQKTAELPSRCNQSPAPSPIKYAFDIPTGSSLEDDQPMENNA